MQKRHWRDRENGTFEEHLNWTGSFLYIRKIYCDIFYFRGTQKKDHIHLYWDKKNPNTYTFTFWDKNHMGITVHQRTSNPDYNHPKTDTARRRLLHNSSASCAGDVYGSLISNSQKGGVTSFATQGIPGCAWGN